MQQRGQHPWSCCRERFSSDVQADVQQRVTLLSMIAGLVLQAGQHPDLASNMVVERPKVIYNDLTEQFVMWMHIDDSR